MNTWQQWIHRPQNLWVRKALFQVHLWVGIGVALYIFVISVSGSAIVYRRQFMGKYARKFVTVAASGPKLSERELQQDMERAYPAYKMTLFVEVRRADQPVTMTLERRKKSIVRLVNPYTGADLGDPESKAERAFLWVVDLHDNLLAGENGRIYNGIGSILATLVALSGMFLWWPGIKNWYRSMGVRPGVSFERFNWDLHSAMGFWSSSFILIWGVSGIYFAFPDLFEAVLDDKATALLARLHFGRMGLFAEAVWTIFGLIPAALVVTGILMWWNRVLKKKIAGSPLFKSRFRIQVQAESAERLGSTAKIA